MANKHPARQLHNQTLYALCSTYTNKSRCIVFAYLFVLITLLTPLTSTAIDLNPFDIVAPPPNKTFFSVTYINAEAQGNYTRGIKSRETPTLSNNQLQLRLGQSYKIGGLTGLSFAQLPVGLLQPGGSASSQPNSQGVGDLTLATALWLHENRETRSYFGVAGYLTLPTGSYSNQQVFNLGGNRVLGDVQVAYQTALSKKWDGMIGFDVMWFAPNHHFGRNNAQFSQQPLYTAQIGPIYHLNQTISFAATYLYVWGAETSINGISNHNALQTHRYLLSAVATTSKGRFTLQYGSNIDTQFGFAETRRIVLRYGFAF